MVDIPFVDVGDIVELKKEHPCPARSNQFKIIRIGADIKLTCLGCQATIMLTRDLFNRRFKRLIRKKE